MARDTLTAATHARAGLTPPAWTLGVVANGLSVPSGWDDRLYVEVENVATGTKVVTVQTALTTDGFAIADYTATIPIGVKAALTTALAGANNDLIFTARRAGVGGNRIKIVYVVAGLGTSLTVSLAGQIITVNVATDGGGAATSTAAQVKTALEANASIDDMISVANAAANDGTGVVTAMASTALSGGIAGITKLGPFTRLETFQQSDGTLYIDVADDNALYFRAYTLP